MGLEVGDMVKLASGGEVMTVAEKTAGGWRCVWHNKKGEEQSGVYAEAMLRKYNPLSRLPIVL